MSKVGRDDSNRALLAFEARLAEMLARLASASSCEVDAAVVDAMRQLCSLLGSERSSIWQGSPSEPTTLRLTHMYDLTQTTVAPQATANELFPWMVEHVLAGETLVFLDVPSMPEAAALDRENLTRLGTKSSLVIPFTHATDGVRGVVTFAATTERASWSDAVISHCRIAAQVMISALSRKRADEAVQEERARLRAVIDSASSDLIWCVDAEGFHLQIWNRAYAEAVERRTGRAPRVGDALEARTGARTDISVNLRQFYERVRRDGPFSTELALAPDEGTLHVTLNRVMSEGRCVAISGFARDITKVLESQKMEALGRLSGGIAHDFNNLLQVMVGVTELVIHELGPQHRCTERLQEVLVAGERAADLTRQLLAFSRKEPQQIQPVDLADVVRNTQKLLGRLLGPDIELTLELGDRPAPVLADASQLHQLLVNLVLNARDSMPDGGPIRVELADVELSPRAAAEHGGIAPGRYHELSVRDSGRGIAPEHLGRVFDPFFTTKERGKGTGLGLATVHGVVKQNGGDVRIESRVGAGTRVVVLLPRADAQVTETRAVASSDLPRGGETVLVAEDHPHVRSVLASMLESCGYPTLLAADGEQALAIAKAHEGRIDLLLTDIIMPRMSGHELARVVREARADIAVLFTSGFSDVAPGQLEQLGNAPLLRKPYSQSAVATAVRAALDDARRRSSASSARDRPH